MRTEEGTAMQNRIATYDDNYPEQDEPEQDIEDVFEELLLRYAARFPRLKIMVVQLPPATV